MVVADYCRNAPRIGEARPSAARLGTTLLCGDAIAA
jgi:hypothetical protein